jgi:hypothetical protein
MILRWRFEGTRFEALAETHSALPLVLIRSEQSDLVGVVDGAQS